MQSLLFILVTLIGVTVSAFAQDISGYAISSKNHILTRELRLAFGEAANTEALPQLDCSVEYIRRLNGKDVVYRRGPIDLTQHGSIAGYKSAPSGSRPTSGIPDTPPYFGGGILVDLPRLGEAAGTPDVRGDEYRYLLRIALIPISYDDQILKVNILLERGIVLSSGRQIQILQSEVFSREVELEGNIPLKFDLPRWDPTIDFGAVVPESLEEGILITLETPRHFALSDNVPDPFSNTTKFTYAVPKKSEVALVIRIQDEEIVLDEGIRQAGRYDVHWTPADVPDDSYSAGLTARDEQGEVLFSGEVTLTKDSDAPPYAAPHVTEITPHRPSGTSRTGEIRQATGVFSVSLEGGMAFQLPADEVKPLSYMFTHVMLRLGYHFAGNFEAGLLIGQDAFNEYPGPEIDTEQIADYGGVVAYTYGYAGAYLRWTVSPASVAPYVEILGAYSGSAMLGGVAFGVKTLILSQIEVYLAPALLAHFKSDISLKLGLNYGVSVRF